MTDFSFSNKHFPHLKEFAAFLLEHHLQEVAEANVQIAREVNLPLLKVFAHMSEQELLAFTKQSLETFLLQLVEQNALDYSKETLLKWRSDTLPHIPRSGVATSDLVLVYHVRKQILLKFIEHYTTDIKTSVSISRELDTFYSELEKFAFHLYVELKEKEYQAVNLNLQGKKAELEEAHEELMASREELQQKNEELKQQISIQQATEHELEKERNFLKAVLEHISDGIVTCDENGVLSFFNYATRQFHGILEKSLPAEQWASYYNLYHADGVTPMAKEDVPLFRAYTGETIVGKEMVIAPVEGKKRLILAKGQPIISSKNEKIGAVVVLQDVTELRQAQQMQKEALFELQEKNKELAAALEELQAAEEKLVQANNELEERVKARTEALTASELQLRTITDALPGMITYIDREERFRFINKTYEEWFGVSRTKVLGKKLEEILMHQAGEKMEKNPYDQVKQYVKRALKGERLHYEITIITKGGKPKHVLINYVPHIEEGQVLGYYALFTDISARVKVELALKQSEARFSNIFNQSSVGMAEVDLTGRFVLVNDRYCQLVGRSRKELYQIRMQDISHEEELPQNISLFQTAVEKGTPFTIEKRYSRVNGTKVWVRNNVSVVKDDYNQPISVVAVCQDITEEKRAARALQESMDLFQSFADNIHSLAWMTDPVGQVLWYNQRWYDYTGTTFEEMQGQGWLKVHHPDHINRVLDHVQKAAGKGENWELTFPLRRADGEWGWFLARAIAIKDIEGKIIRWVGTSTEITEQVKAQQLLQKANEENVDLLQRETEALKEAQQQKERLYNLFMQAPSLLCINRGREFIYELANPSYLEVFMVDASIIGKAALDVFPDADPAIVQIYTSVFETGQRFVGKEMPITGDWKRNDSPYTRYFNLIYEPLKEADGSISGIITFGYEVSDHVKARQALEQTASVMQNMNLELDQKNQELGRINNDLDNFIYTASHDLRSPIVNLEGLVMVLKQHLHNPTAKKTDTLIGMMETSISKLHKTIVDLTEITKAQKGLSEAKEEVSIQEILDDIKADQEQNIQEANPKLEVDFQVLRIFYARRSLRSILYNLLTNALKYKSNDRPLEINIRTFKEGDFVVLTVQDNGLGMNEQQLPKLFTMFKRLHTHVEGTGVGLYIVKRIIENSGGKIVVDTKENVGSTFKVYIPQKHVN